MRVHSATLRHCHGQLGGRRDSAGSRGKSPHQIVSSHFQVVCVWYPLNPGKDSASDFTGGSFRPGSGRIPPDGPRQGVLDGTEGARADPLVFRPSVEERAGCAQVLAFKSSTLAFSCLQGGGRQETDMGCLGRHSTRGCHWVGSVDITALSCLGCPRCCRWP